MKEKERGKQCNKLQSANVERYDVETSNKCVRVGSKEEEQDEEKEEEDEEEDRKKEAKKKENKNKK